MSKSIFRSIWSMIIMNILILIATLTIHELGHALTGKILGCVTARAIIYDSENMNPYTELICLQTQQKVAYSAGLILTTIFGLSFLTIEKPYKMFSIIIIGFGVFLAALDIVEITRLNVMQYIFILLGLSSLIIGQILYGISNIKD
ncbi:MAG: hypothetical protein QXJ06_02670 [Candidatus Aenigmatarchaeota archaeon]